MLRPIDVAPAIGSDAEEIVALHQAIAIQRKPEHLAPWPVHSVDQVRMMIGAADVFVARDAGVLVASFRLTRAKPYPTGVRFRSDLLALELVDMAVDPTRQGQGVGPRCLEEARRFAKEVSPGVAAIHLDTDSERAVRVYKRCGFVEVGRVSEKVYLQLIL